MLELIFTCVMLPACWAVVGMSACRLNQLDRLKSKPSWLLGYLALALLAAAAGLELLTVGHAEFGDARLLVVLLRAIEAALVFYALLRLWRSRKHWRGSGVDALHQDAAPPESNRAPLGDR